MVYNRSDMNGPDIAEIVSRYMWVHEFQEDSTYRIFRGNFFYNPDRSAEALYEELKKAGYYASIREGGTGYYEVVVFREYRYGRGNPLVNLVLFILTVFTTLVVGVTLKGINPFIGFPGSLVHGIPFSFSLLLILGCHELGHYFASRRHDVEATLPYFLPVPHPLLGTLGAFIRIKSPIPSRKVLLDIGAAGPIVGALVALPITVVGIHLSRYVPRETAEGGILMGSSLLFGFLENLVKGSAPQGHDLLLNPMAYAGWFGFFITSLNLFPLGQLDGGHIAYALLGKNHRFVARAFFLILLGLGFLWPGYWFWAFLTLFLGLDHPPPLNNVTRLDGRRRTVAWISFLLFIITFVPVPFKVL